MALGGKNILLLGATGTIGRATALACQDDGHHVACVVRPGKDVPPKLAGVEVIVGDVTDTDTMRETVFGARAFDVVVSCLASRTGAPDDAWAIDHQANVTAMMAARDAGVGQFIFLSAICVQKPRLAFQHAKLAAEEALVATGMPYSIVRPTAFFKSLSGQIARVQSGKPFLMFGDGSLASCKPISDADLGRFISGCIDAPARLNRILPIGGPGPAISPCDQAAYLFEKLERPLHVKRVPLAMMRGIAGTLSFAARVVPSLRAKAEFARIGLYYAAESMLVWDEAAQAYAEDATPSFGKDRLFDYYDALLTGEAEVERGAHSVF